MLFDSLLAAFLLLQRVPGTACNCALYGCTLSASFTCPTDFYSGSFYPELASSYEDKDLKPTGSGCATNAALIVCPLVGNDTNVMMVWNVDAQLESWNASMKSLVTLPSIELSGNVYVTDGDDLCAYESSGVPLGPCIKMEPTTGPIYDLTVVAEKFLYLLYKCGFMVAYFTNGIPYASIWMNATTEGVNGTYIPLSNPAVVGERVYFIAAFKPISPLTMKSTFLRLYAMDVRSVMVGRIKIIWYHDLTLSGVFIPYIEGDQAKCTGVSDPLETVADTIVEEGGTVLVFVNYVSQQTRLYGGGRDMPPPTNSLMMSVTDKGDDYQVNFVKETLPPFQATAYVSPNFTCLLGQESAASAAAKVPSVWVSWAKSATSSVIEKLDAKTGVSISTITIPSLGEFTLTSKLNIFYNDQLIRELCAAGNASLDVGGESVLTPLVFGYHSVQNKTYSIAAVDVANSDHPELRWSVQLPGNAPALGQITTVGSGRDTMMVVTTTNGVYFYVLYSD